MSEAGLISPQNMRLEGVYTPGITIVDNSDLKAQKKEKKPDMRDAMGSALIGVASRTSFLRIVVKGKGEDYRCWLSERDAYKPGSGEQSIPEVIREGPITVLTQRAAEDIFTNADAYTQMEAGYYTRAIKERLRRGPKIQEGERARQSVIRFIDEFVEMVDQAMELGQGGRLLLSAIGKDPELNTVLDILSLLNYEGITTRDNAEKSLDLIANLGILRLLSWDREISWKADSVKDKSVRSRLEELLVKNSSRQDEDSSPQGEIKWGDINLDTLLGILNGSTNKAPRRTKRGKKSRRQKSNRHTPLTQEIVRGETDEFLTSANFMKKKSMQIAEARKRGDRKRSREPEDASSNVEETSNLFARLRGLAEKEAEMLVDRIRSSKVSYLQESEIDLNSSVEVSSEGEKRIIPFPVSPMMRKYYELYMERIYKMHLRSSSNNYIFERLYTPDGRIFHHLRQKRFAYKTPSVIDTGVAEMQESIKMVRETGVPQFLSREQVTTIVRTIPGIPSIYTYGKKSKTGESVQNPKFLDIIGDLKDEFQKSFVVIGPTPIKVESISDHNDAGLDGITFRSATRTLPNHQGEIEVVFDFLGTKIYGIFDREGLLHLPIEYDAVVRSKLELLALAYLETLRDRSESELVRMSVEPEEEDGADISLIDRPEPTQSEIGETFMGMTIRANPITEIPNLDVPLDREGHPDHGKTPDVLVQEYYGFSLREMNAELLKCMIYPKHFTELQETHPSLAAKLEIMLKRISNKQINVGGSRYQTRATKETNIPITLVDEKGQTTNLFKVQGDSGHVDRLVEMQQNGEIEWRPGMQIRRKEFLKIAGMAIERSDAVGGDEASNQFWSITRYRMFLADLVRSELLTYKEMNRIVDKGVPPVSISFKSEAKYNRPVTVRVDEKEVKRRISGKKLT